MTNYLQQRVRRIAAIAALGGAAGLGACALWMSRPAAADAPLYTAEHVEYASPVETLYSPDGRRIYVLCQESGEVRVLDAASFKQLGRVTIGRVTRGMTLSPDGARLFVTSSWEDSLSVVDTAKLEVVSKWKIGSEPTGVVIDRAGKQLYVANRISNDIAVLDASTGEEIKRLMAGRGSSYLTLSPDGSRIYGTHVYPNAARHSTEGGNREEPESEITTIDVARERVVDHMPLHHIAGVFHLALSKDGRVGAAAEYHPKNLVPLAHLEHGAAFEYTLTLFGADVGPDPVEVPLDELEQYASRPFGVAITPDKSKLYVSCGGSEAVIAIDLQKLLRYIHTNRKNFALDLGASVNYVAARIPVGHDPRGLTVSPDGTKLLIPNRLDDTISIVDTRTNRVQSTVVLEGPKRMSILRHGEQTFYSSRYSFQGQIACATCHIDSTFDGLTWDLEPDGFGRDVVDNRPIEDLVGTEPYKWNGGNPNLPTECGPRTEKYFWRSENYSDLQLADLVTYVRSIPPRPNRWRLPAGQLTSAQERGKAIFERSVDKFGKPIAETNRCSYCHSGKKGTNQQSFDVGTRKSTDNTGKLDTPQLTNIELSAPYLHDGSARTLEEIWTVFNPEDKHGRTNDLTKDELNDLIEYLRTR